MNIRKASQEDVPIIDEIVKREFPYTKIPQERIAQKISEKNFLILVACQANIFTGFAETELLENEARLNGIFVEDAWRDQKIATNIIKKTFEELKKQKIFRIFLLVKESNDGAKKLYEKNGFKFEKIHDKEIEGEKIEIWSQQLN
ncbi:MAG: GNAT family N-acetyltransferase [archaeon]